MDGYYNERVVLIINIGLVGIGLRLAQCSKDMKLSNLQILYLENVKVHQQRGICWFFTSCPMIKEIRLLYICDLEHLKVYGLRLLFTSNS